MLQRIVLLLTVLFWPAAGLAQPPPGPTDAIDLVDLVRLARSSDVVKRLLPPADLVLHEDGLRLLTLPMAMPLPEKADPEGLIHLVLVENPKEKASLRFKEVKSIAYWEDRVVQAVLEARAGKPTAEDLQAGEWLLRAALRFHEVARTHPVDGADPWQSLGDRLHGELTEARVRLLRAWPRGATRGDWAEALLAARAWLALDARSRTLGEAVADLFARHARARWREGDGAEASASLAWLAAHPPLPEDAIAVKNEMRTLAVQRVKEAADLPDAKAIGLLREALVLWPHAPGAADDLARRLRTFRVLYVGVPELPRRLTPFTAATAAERQALDLIFARLTARHWRRNSEGFFSLASAELTADLPRSIGRSLPLAVAENWHWPDGKAVTSADLRQTYELATGALAGRNPLLREFVARPRLPSRADLLELTLRQDLFDPLLITNLHVLPWQYPTEKGPRTLEGPSDAEFAARPFGCGPFVFSGIVKEEGVEYAVFRANPGYPRSSKAAEYLGEVRLFVWSGPMAKKEPRPHLLLAPAGDGAALAKLGYRRPETAPGRVLHFLAVNHMHPLLALPEVRQALAHGVPRSSIAAEQWNKEAKGVALSASGPFAQGTWAYPPPSMFPRDPFPKGADRLRAAAAARRMSDALKTQKATLTLLHPAGDDRIGAACARIAKSWQDLFLTAGVELNVKLRPLAAHDLSDAMDRREYELAWRQLDHPEDPALLWALLDDDDKALAAPWGGNVLGYGKDPDLIGLFRKTVSEQSFPQVQAGLHKLHVHIHQTMPFIPLWHVSPQVAVHSSLTTGLLDPRRPFGAALEWSIKP